MSPMINPNATGGAIPAQGNPQMGQTPNLSPDAISALKKDPDVLKARLTVRTYDQLEGFEVQGVLS